MATERTLFELSTAILSFISSPSSFISFSFMCTTFLSLLKFHVGQALDGDAVAVVVGAGAGCGVAAADFVTFSAGEGGDNCLAASVVALLFWRIPYATLL